jgi:foldase protein PrsA
MQESEVVQGNLPDNTEEKRCWRYTPQLILLIALLLVGGLWTWWIYRGDWVLRVNGQPLSNAQLTEQTLKTADYLSKNYQVDLNGSGGTKMLAQVKQEVLQQMIDRALLLQAASNAGVLVKDSDIETQIKADKLQCGGEQQYLQILKAQGMTDQIYRAQVKQMMAIQKLESKLTDSIKVSEAELKKDYQAKKSQLTNPARAKVAHILVKTEADAEKVLAELNGGADFQAMALKYSIDPSKTQNKGLIGDIVQNDQQIPINFIQAAFTTPVGTYTKTAVKTTMGYHIIFVYDRKPVSQSQFDEVRSSLEQQLVASKKNDTMTKYLKGLRQNAAYIYRGKKPF